MRGLVTKTWKKYLQEIKPTYWLFLVRENGNMEMYTLPDFQQMYLVRNFGQGLRVLSDSTQSVPPSMTTDTTYDTEVQEILVVALGHHGSRPLLVVRLEDEVLLYQAYRYHKGNLKLRFRRLAHTVLLRESRSSEESDIHSVVDSDAISEEDGIELGQ
ncbi:unnamed protein product, partial [Timema podura]|nr:unnamed protein product [Timema podura]